MAKLNFKYGTMNASKTIDLIRTAYNYEGNGFKVLVIKPTTDTKAKNKISSRVGIERKVDLLVSKDDNIIEILGNKVFDNKCIFVDEAQFLTRTQVGQLSDIANLYDVDVICYGLRLNFKMEAFEGSMRLLEMADSLEELKTICKCGEIARTVGRKVDGEFVIEGEEVVIDGEENNVEYVPLCTRCYLVDVMNKELPKKKIKK